MGLVQSRRPAAHGRLGRGAALAAVLLGAAPPAHAAPLLDGLAGRWATRSGPALAMEWSPRGDGFGLRWSIPGGGEAQATFEPSDRPGLLFAGRDEGWSMFGGGESSNPLLDGPLEWARTTPEAVYVYRLVIDGGGAFVIDRFACRPAGDGLDVDFQRRLPDGRTEESRMRLTRAPS